MFKDDEKWVADQVRFLPFDMRSKAINNYRSVYDQVYARTNGGDIHKIQAARTEANTRLRIYISKLKG